MLLKTLKLLPNLAKGWGDAHENYCSVTLPLYASGKGLEKFPDENLSVECPYYFAVIVQESSREELEEASWNFCINNHLHPAEIVRIMEEEEGLRVELTATAFPFSDCFGYVNIEVLVMNGWKLLAKAYAQPVSIVIPEGPDRQNIVNIIHYVFQKNRGRLTNCQILESDDDGDEKFNGKAGADLALEKLRKSALAVIKTYERNFKIFSSYQGPMVSGQEKKISMEEIKYFSSSVYEFIVTHPEELVPVAEHTGIQFGGIHYQPKHSVLNVTNINKDTYENRIVIGFLEHFCETCKNIAKFLVVGSDLGEIPKIDGYSNSSEFLQMTSLSTYSGYQKEFQKFYKKGRNILLNLRQYFPIREFAVRSVPELTPVFRANVAYHAIYLAIQQWFRAKPTAVFKAALQVDYGRSSRIYEYYCLLKIMEALECAGYELIESRKQRWRVNFQFDKEETGRNVFVFAGHDEEITLFYQPSVWTTGEGEKAGLGLYRNSLIRIMEDNKAEIPEDKTEAMYLPDFVLKREKDGRADYYLIDAKFSVRSFILQNRLSNLILKYLLSISPIHPQDRVMGLLVLCGKGQDDEVVENIRNVPNPVTGIPEQQIIQVWNLNEVVPKNFEFFHWKALINPGDNTLT